MLNEALNDPCHGVKFELVRPVNVVTNQSWFNNIELESAAEREMKKSLRKGGFADLNVYSVE